MTEMEIEIQPTDLNPISGAVLQCLMERDGGNLLPKGNYKLPVLGLSVELTQSLIKRPSSKSFFLQRWEIVGKKLGKGAFSTVYQSEGCLKPEKGLIYSPAKTPRVIKEIKYNNHRGINVTARQVAKEEQKTNAGSDFLHCKAAFFSPKQGFLTMRQAPGLNLLDFIMLMQEGKINVSYLDLLKISHSIVTTVHDLHKKGWIHRDLKPENIIIDPENYTIKLIDFDFIKPILFPAQPYKSLKGTPGFIPPDAWRTFKTSTAVDWFAIGWTLAQLWGDTALNDAFFHKLSNYQLSEFLEKETFENLFHGTYVPEEAEGELRSILQGFIVCDEKKRLRGYDATKRFEKLINDYDPDPLPVCTLV